MDERTVEVMDTSDTVETEVISTNQVLTLITTEDGIPTSTEVTVLTTALGDVPLMTTSLGTLAEVPLVTTHPTFVTSHSGVRTVYTTSINSSHTGQPLVVGEGQIAVLDSNGVQQTIVVHTNPSQLTALSGEYESNEAQPQLISVDIQEALPLTETVTVTEPMTVTATSVVVATEEKVESDSKDASVNNQEQISTSVNNCEVSNAIVESENFAQTKVANPEYAKDNIVLEGVETAEELSVSDTVEISPNKDALDSNCDKDIVPSISSANSNIPEEVVCMVCYQAFLNPNRGKKEIANDSNTNSTNDDNSTKPNENEPTNESACYGRTLGNFFEISRINMSIVTRRSYKEHNIPICQKCNNTLTEAEEILTELRRLERELYFLRQRVKDEILTSYLFYKNEENKELAKSRRTIAGLVEILDVVDHIRDDIINDGRPPKIPRSVVNVPSSNRRGRKPKISAIDKNESKNTASDAQHQENKSAPCEGISIKDTVIPPQPSLEVDVGPEKSEIKEKEKTVEIENEDEKDRPAIRTSFGRVVKRPTYMLNEIKEDELSDLFESSDEDYEEIEVKPELPAVDGESIAAIINEDEMDEEDPAWSPGRGMFVSERVGIPPSSSDVSDIFSEEDSDVETTSKVKTKKEVKEKKVRKIKHKQSYKRRTKKRSPVVKQEDMNYEVKVIQLDGTELMTINTSRAGENIGLEPAITQKVMDSQAVIMVKNQLFGRRVQCHHCPRTFTDPHRRDIHVKKKHEGITKPFECEVCQKRFSRQDHLKNHMKRHTRPPKDKIYKPKHSTSEKTHSCEYCEQRFRNKSELAVHIRTHTGEKPYKCEYCAEAFVSALKREFHIEQMHPEVPPLRCEFCSKGFFRQHRLRIHAISHTGEKANICELCGKSFSQAAMLRYHQTTHEELNLKQFKCQQCNKVFANPQNLKSHMESQHQKMYRHRCPHCDRGYTQMSHLRRHLRTHSGEQPFICSYCPKRFTSGAALKIHVRIHTGERPYWCSLCEKGFRSKTKLGRHLKTLIHSGENKDRIKKETVTTEIETVDINATAANTWTEIVGIITGV